MGSPKHSLIVVDGPRGESYLPAYSGHQALSGDIEGNQAALDVGDQVRLQHAVDLYLLARSNALAATSRREMRHVLYTFTRIVGEDLPARKLTRRHIDRWMAARTISASTLRNQLGVVRGFTSWLVHTGRIKKDPTFGVIPPKEPRRMPRELCQEDIDKTLLNVVNVRDRLILMLLRYAGLRRGEVARLQVGDVNLPDRLLFIVGKGGHERVVPVAPALYDCLIEYRAICPHPAGPLLRNLHRPQYGISPGYISQIVRDALEAAGVKERPYDGKSAHAYRHSWAGQLLDAGTDIRVVQHGLGHASLAATYIYLRRRQDVDGLREAVNQLGGE